MASETEGPETIDADAALAPFVPVDVEAAAVAFQSLFRKLKEGRPKSVELPPGQYTFEGDGTFVDPMLERRQVSELFE